MEPGYPIEDRNDIESCRERGRGLAQKGARRNDQSPLLRRVDRRLRAAESRSRTSLDLDEDERRSIACDDIELPPRRPPVPRDDFVPLLAKESTGPLLRLPA